MNSKLNTHKWKTCCQFPRLKFKLCKRTYLYHARLSLPTCLFFLDVGQLHNVSLPYFTFGYIHGRATKSVGSLLWRKNILMHYLSPHDIHATLSINCKYISFNPNVPCLNEILTNSMLHFLLNCTAMFIIARIEVLLITQTRVLVKHTTLIDECINKR